MKLLNLLFAVLLLSVAAPALGQTDEIEQLLTEREVLMQEYEYFNSQKSNFWGKQSKKDLINVIGVLKNIIRNDTKLVTAYKAEQLRRTASLTAENQQLNQQVKSDRGMIDESIYTLQDQVKTLQNKQKLRDKKIAELEEELKDEKKAANRTEQYLFVTGIMLALSLGYIFFKRKGKTARPRTRR